LDDPRIEKNRTRRLINIIIIAILGVICGADTGVDIERCGNAKAALMSFQNRRYHSAT
jgi:hypothetical protein